MKTFGTSVLCAVTLAALVGGGIALNKNGYERGVKLGIDEGRYQQKEYAGLMEIADSCYKLGAKYDATPDAEKIKQGVPLKWDNATTCDRFKATAEDYLK